MTGFYAATAKNLAELVPFMTLDELFAQAEAVDAYINMTTDGPKMIVGKCEVEGKLPLAVHLFDFRLSINPVARVYRSEAEGGKVKILYFSQRVDESDVIEGLRSLLKVGINFKE